MLTTLPHPLNRACDEPPEEADDGDDGAKTQGEEKCSAEETAKKAIEGCRAVVVEDGAVAHTKEALRVECKYAWMKLG
jgi:hypothetical protein